MNRQQKIEFLKNLESGEIDINKIFEDKILVITGHSGPQLNDETTISDNLKRHIKQSFYDWNGTPPRALCHIDENNVLQPGIKYREKKS